jgi:phage/conjugal plasmid C-4 type zinc finger TraR family protein
MDDIDRAQHHNEQHLAQALAAHKAGRARPTSSSATHCLDCGDPIPLARRQAVPGCVRCVVCQREADQNP